MCMLNRSLKAADKVKNNLFSAKQDKFAKLNSTHRKGHQKKKRKVTLIINQRSLRDSTISHGVCVGEMLVLKAICDALTH